MLKSVEKKITLFGGALVLAGGIVFTYGQLTSEVEALGYKVDNWREYNDSSIIAFASSNFQSLQELEKRVLETELKVRMAESMFSEYNRNSAILQKGGF